MRPMFGWTARVRALRRERGHSITDAAQKAGISVGSLSQIEHGITSLHVRALWPLAAALQADSGNLIEDESDRASDLYVVPGSSPMRGAWINAAKPTEVMDGA
jgi:transcriptional regulator with XRE-family HTH domain